MSQKPVKRDDAPIDRDPVEELGELGFVLITLAAVPPIWLYPERETGEALKRSWWLYLSFIPIALLLFWPLIEDGNYEMLLLTPIMHLVVLAVLIATIAPTVLPGWPESLAAPAWAPGEQMLLLLLAVPVVAGVARLLTQTYDISDGEMGIPMSEVTEKSANAGVLPTFERGVCSLLIGETGSGKSSALKMLVYQFHYGENVATIAHDLKRDFWTFYREHTDMTVERLSIEDSTVIWNLFLDVREIRQYNEIAKGIMGEPDGSNPFHKGATQVLADVMIYLHQQGEEREKTPDHADLLAFLNKDIEALHKVLRDNDLAGAASIDPDTGGARNTYLTMMENVRDIFVGDFAKSGDFSLREYIENPNNRAIMIDTKIDEIATTGPMFRLILDLSIKFGMTADNDVNYVLDEIDQLPRLSRLSSLASAGRGVGVRGIIGIQTVGQLKAVYGRAVAGILGNCPQGIYFSPGESETVDYALDELGERRESITSSTESKSGSGDDARSSRSRTTREEERTPITSGELKQFRAGDAIVKNRTMWWIGRVEMLDNVQHDLDRAGVGIGAQAVSNDTETELTPQGESKPDESTDDDTTTEETDNE